MKYAYDVVLNFNDEFYNFYEWDTDDTIAYVKLLMILLMILKLIMYP